jgi:hypothetical protein
MRLNSAFCGARRHTTAALFGSLALGALPTTASAAPDHQFRWRDPQRVEFHGGQSLHATHRRASPQTGSLRCAGRSKSRHQHQNHRKIPPVRRVSVPGNQSGVRQGQSQRQRDRRSRNQRDPRNPRSCGPRRRTHGSESQIHDHAQEYRATPADRSISLSRFRGSSSRFIQKTIPAIPRVRSWRTLPAWFRSSISRLPRRVSPKIPGR